MRIRRIEFRKTHRYEEATVYVTVNSATGVTIVTDGAEGYTLLALTSTNDDSARSSVDCQGRWSRTKPASCVVRSPSAARLKTHRF